MSSPSAAPKPLDTPPSSDREPSPRLPPSPPQSPEVKQAAAVSAVDRLVAILFLHSRGRLSNTGKEEHDWRTFRLTRAQFAELEARIGQEGLRGWGEDKARYDWEAPASEREGARGRLVLRMPSAVHERFNESVKQLLWTGIAGLAGRFEERKQGEDDEGKTIAAELRKIVSGGSTTLKMHVPKLENSSQESAGSGEGEERVVRRSPDASFIHPASDMPSLVVEVSYSQQQRDLPRLAESYIIDSQHRVRCVVGLDIPYAGTRRTKGDQSATVSVWRAATETDEEGEEVGICRQDVAALPFRDVHGGGCDGALELTPADLLPLHVVSNAATTCTDQPQLRIPFTALASGLTGAQRKSRSTSSLSSAAAPAKFRKRKRSPDEALDEEQEKQYLRLEENERAKDGRVDGEWSTSRRRIAGGAAVVERRRSGRLSRRGDAG